MSQENLLTDEEFDFLLDELQDELKDGRGSFQDIPDISQESDPTEASSANGMYAFRNLLNIFNHVHTSLAHYVRAL